MQTPGEKQSISKPTGLAALVFTLLSAPNLAHAQFFDATIGNAAELLMDLIYKIIARITGVIGRVLDYVVEGFVVNMAESINEIGAIDQLWQTFRDLGNIVFIAILLYAAISIILGVGNKIQTKQVVINLVIVALFVNFSLFATKAVIDTANITALQFYNNIQVVNCEQECTLSNFFAGAVNISSTESEEILNDTSNTRIAFARLLGSVFYIILAFVMGAAALMLGIRFVVLILLMIFSPLAFIAFILPDSQNLGRKWLDALLSNAFFAPAMFAMIYVAARVATGVQEMAGEDTTNLMSAVLNPDGDMFGALIVYFIVIAFLIAAIVIAKQIGAVGAKKTISYGQKARNWGQTKVKRASKAVAYAPVKAAGAGAREGVGRAGKWADDKFKRTRFAQGNIGKKVRENTTKKAKNASFGLEKGYDDVRKERDAGDRRQKAWDKRKETADVLKSNANDTVKRDKLNDLTRSQRIEMIKNNKDSLKDNAHLLDSNTLKEFEKKARSDKDDDSAFKEEDIQEFKDAISETLETKVSVKLDEVANSQFGTDFANLSQTQKDAVSSSDTFKNEVKDYLGNRTDDQLKELNQNIVTNSFVVENMSEKQLEKAKENRTRSEKSSIDTARLSNLQQANNTGAAAVDNYFDGKNNKEIASRVELAVKNGVRSDAIIDQIGPVELENMSNLSDNEKEQLRQHITQRATGPGGSNKNTRAAEYLMYGPGASKF